jgi:hypothetical protein
VIAVTLVIVRSADLVCLYDFVIFRYRLSWSISDHIWSDSSAARLVPLSLQLSFARCPVVGKSSWSCLEPSPKDYI